MSDPADQTTEQPAGESYETLVARVREAVAHVVPAGATVAVVSRGDDDLLQLGDRTGWHFPQLERGVWAGHYPADSGEAIAQLETLRSRGAEYLVFPRTAMWWLEHYEGFAEHLLTHCRRLHVATDSCTIFHVDTVGVTALVEPDHASDQRRRRMLAELSSILDAILPAAATVLVMGGDDADRVRLDGRRVWHLPGGANGAGSDDGPAADSIAIERLEQARAAGGRYLVVPRTGFGWLERHPAFALHVRTAYRTVTHQREICVVHDLTGAAQTDA